MAYEMKGAAGAKGRPRGGIVPGARPGSGSAATGMKGMNSKGGAENENDDELQADHELLGGHPSMGGKKGSLYGGGPPGPSSKGKGKHQNFRTTPLQQQPQMNKHAVALAAAAVDPGEFGEDQLAKVYEGVDAGDGAGENNLLAETSSRSRQTTGAGTYGASSTSTLNYGHFDLPDVVSNASVSGSGVMQELAMLPLDSKKKAVSHEQQEESSFCCVERAFLIRNVHL